MKEVDFFNHYVVLDNTQEEKHRQLDAFRTEIAETYSMVPELPLSNIWVAQQVVSRFPSSACLELGVSNTMRSYTFFEFKEETYILANTGCRGIDGAIPTLLGMSLARPDKVHFAVMGDLTFFYSFNVLGNRHVGDNIRILLINNGCGEEFNIYPHRAYKLYDGNHDRINEFIAAGGHNGKKSVNLVKHYAEDLGFEYLTASNKEEFNCQLDYFLDVNTISKPMLFEVFTDMNEENDALKLIRNCRIDAPTGLKQTIKKMIGK